MSTKTVAIKKKKFNCQRGELYLADLNPTKGSEQGGIRPVLILQNNFVNRLFNTTIVAAVSSSQNAKDAQNFPTNVFINRRGNLKNDSVVKLTQIILVDKEERFIKYIDKLTDKEMEEVDKAMKFNLAIGDKCNKCGNLIELNGLICKKCKNIVKKECSECKSILNLDWLYCPICGKEV